MHQSACDLGWINLDDITSKDTHIMLMNQINI